MSSHFYVFYPHGMSLIEQLLYELRSMSFYALPDPTLANTSWTGLIILNRESSMMEKWEQHFRGIERLLLLERDDQQATEVICEMNRGTLALLSEDKEVVRIIQHWERWDWQEAAEILRKNCGIRLNGTPLRKPLSEQQEMAIDDYLQRSTGLARKVQNDEDRVTIEILHQKLQERIKTEEKFYFTLNRLQA